MNLFGLGIIPIVVIITVIILFGIFSIFYCWNGYKVWKQLKSTTQKLKDLEKGKIKEKYVIETLFSDNQRLKEIWRKYAETLHAQFENQDGQRTLICLRATVPAENFFNNEVLVDTPLHTDFFKHLPGILTGIGIIGTFLGLISGLEHFNVDTDAEKLQNNLGLLLSAVREAFIASGVAIGAAIFVTFLEKFILNQCYHSSDELVQVIDTLYEAGAGEEYLSQLVDSASESATQTRLLKDALVTDLKELLTNFTHELASHTEKQTIDLIEANRIEQGHFRESLVEAMKNGLEAPMQTIVEVTKTLGGNQGEAVNDLFTALISRIDDTFGGQMRGLNDMMAHNTQLMEGMQQRFSVFLDQLEQAGKNSQSAQSEHLESLMNKAEERQQKMNEQVNQALFQISSTVSQLMESLSEQKNAIGEAGQQGLDAISVGLAAILDELKNTASQTSSIFNDELLKVFNASGQRQDELSKQIRFVIEQMQQNQSIQGTQLQSQLKQSLEQITEIAEKMDQHRIMQDAARIASDEKRLQKLDAEMFAHFQRISESVLGLTQTVESISEGINKSISHLERVTVDGSVSLKNSAHAMLDTATAFDSAGKQVSQVLLQTNISQEKLISASESLGHASQSLEKGLLDYQEYRKQVEAMIVTLKALLQETENKTVVNRDLVSDMTDMVEQSRQLQIEANAFITQSGEVLKTGFDGFADAVTTNMDKSRAAFDKGLGQAVEMISGQIQELEAVLDQLIRAASKK